MTRLRPLLGLAAAVLLVGGAVVHSVFGWSRYRAALLALQAPADLVTGLAIGWHFGGAAMVALAVVVWGTFAHRLRGRPASTRYARLIALLYLLGAAGAIAVSGKPFFAVFLAPAVLLLAASWGRAPDTA